uniref:Uncharacterized protein n=1 Tax=Mycena chlorophos TaxID=658473 RepID=A0ABQ0LQP0_MYCCL|nr:predicted protein [Mycena chlorophos]
MASSSSTPSPAGLMPLPPTPPPQDVSVPLVNIISAFIPETRPLARKYLKSVNFVVDVDGFLNVCALEGFNIYYHALAHSLVHPERDIPAHVVLTDAFAFLPAPAEEFARAHFERLGYYITDDGDLHVRALPPYELHFSAFLAAIKYGDALLDAERTWRNVQKSLGTSQALAALEEYM